MTGKYVTFVLLLSVLLAGTASAQADPSAQNTPPAQASGQQTAPTQPQPAEKATLPAVTPPVTGSPQTRIFDATVVNKKTEVTGAPDPLLDTPPAPRGDPTLIGGIATKVDRVRNRIDIEPFGTKRRVRLYIDERTRLYRDQVEITILGIQQGDRVYADTMLDGARVFAKNVRVLEKGGPAEVRGQITAYDAERRLVTLQDALSQRPVTFAVNEQTAIQGGAGTASLTTGALIDVQFWPAKAQRGVARQITVLAAPGANYLFAGVVTNVNMRDGVLSIENQSDGKVYDVEFTPQTTGEDVLRVGANLSITATFDGAAYRASRITPVPASAALPSDEQK